ncbi:MAG: HAD-IA family hydrolase [Vicinamibacterales bacterium]
MVFDLDGTLVDSRRDLADAANLVLEECGGRGHSEEAIGRMVGDGAATLVARAFTAAGVLQPADALERFLRVYNGRLLRHTRPYDGIPDLLTRLEGYAPLAVLTNKPIGPTRVILDALGLAKHFGGRVLGGDGPFPRKPDPAGLQALMADIATPADTLLVGDSIIDCKTAHAADATACLARYGFGAHGFPMSELRPRDLTIDDPLQLVGLV